MRRRQLLAGLATSAGAPFTGCTALQSDGTDTQSRSSDQQPFAFRVTLLAAEPARGRPPVLRIAIRNTDTEAHTLTISNDAFPFATARSAGSAASLVLAEDVPSERDGDCWRGYPKVLPRINGTTFNPGESVSATYAVLNANDNAVCWPIGSVEFIETYYLDSESPHSIEGGRPFAWGFSLAVNGDGSLSLEGAGFRAD